MTTLACEKGTVIVTDNLSGCDYFRAARLMHLNSQEVVRAAREAFGADPQDKYAKKILDIGVVSESEFLEDMVDYYRPQQRDKLWIANAGGRAVGYGIGWDVDSREFSCEGIFVSHEARGMGLAKKIVGAQIDYARGSGFSTFTTKIARDNHPSIGMMKGFGPKMTIGEDGRYDVVIDL